MLALAGTVISALIVGYGLWGFQQTGAFYLSDTPLDALIFGALISATDPVATLATFGELHVDHTLYALVFGESILNDAVAITMYDILCEFAGGSEFGAQDLFQALGLFLLSIVGSLGIGCSIAALASLLFKYIVAQSRNWAIAVFFCVGYVSYTLAQGVGLSGIFAIFFGAFVLRHYAFYNVSAETRASLQDLLKTVALVSETVIYVLLGLAFYSLGPAWDFAFLGIALFLCLAARAFSVLVLVNLANLGRRIKIPFNFQVRWQHENTGGQGQHKRGREGAGATRARAGRGNTTEGGQGQHKRGREGEGATRARAGRGNMSEAGQGQNERGREGAGATRARAGRGTAHRAHHVDRGGPLPSGPKATTNTPSSVRPCLARIRVLIRPPLPRPNPRPHPIRILIRPPRTPALSCPLPFLAPCPFLPPAQPVY